MPNAIHLLTMQHTPHQIISHPYLKSPGHHWPPTTVQWHRRIFSLHLPSLTMYFHKKLHSVTEGCCLCAWSPGCGVNKETRDGIYHPALPSFDVTCANFHSAINDTNRTDSILSNQLLLNCIERDDRRQHIQPRIICCRAQSDLRTSFWNGYSQGGNRASKALIVLDLNRKICSAVQKSCQRFRKLDAAQQASSGSVKRNRI